MFWSWFWSWFDKLADSQWATRIGFIGDLIDLISLIVTLAFTWIILNLRKYLMNEHDLQQEDYNKNRKKIIQSIEICRKNLVEDRLLEMARRKYIGDTLQALCTYERNYNRLLKKQDRTLLQSTISLLEKIQDSHLDQAEEDSLIDQLNTNLAKIEAMFSDIRLNRQKE